jgi:hypothetical protein
MLSVQYIIDHSVAPIVSVSYGLCELGLGTAGNTQWANMWKTAATAGMSVFVATGDAGASTCDQGGDIQFPVPYAADFGLSVNGIGSTPDITAVGGTDLNWGSTASPYWNDSNASNGSSAKGYMPEVPWNDTCTNPLLLTPLQNLATHLGLTKPTDAESACNFIINNETAITASVGDLSSLVDTVGGGGGRSTCTTSDSNTVASCSGGYTQPDWQTGVSNIPTDGKRAVPDVSFFAGNGFNGSAYLICVTGTGVTCTYPTDAFPASGLEIGGTSAATPAMAGVMALINQKAGSQQGNAAPEMYKLAAKQNYGNCVTETVTNSSTCYFNDITTGTIAMACDNGLLQAGTSPDCTVNHTGDKVGVLNGYAAGAAFDRATGLGSMNVANTANAWATFVGTGSTTVTVTPATSTVRSADSLGVTGTVSGASGTPTGSVSLSGAGYASAAIPLDGSGKFSFTIPGYSFKSAGSIALTARYSGDDTYAANNGTAPLTINLSAFTLSATNLTLTAGDKSGSANVSNVTVTPTNGYTGTVTLTAQMQSGPPGGIDPPTFTGSQVTITDSSQKSGTITVASTAAAAVRPGSGRLAWLGAAGGTALTALLLFCVPVGFRRGRRIFSMLLLVVAAGFGFIGCGGGGGGGGGGGNQKSTPTVTVSATKNIFSTAEAIPVSISVSGGSTTATGTVTLSSGAYASASTALASGGAKITIPASTLSAGSATLTATYSGDSNFNAASGTATVTINKPGTTAGTYTILVTGTGNDPASTTTTTTFTMTVN